MNIRMRNLCFVALMWTIAGALWAQPAEPACSNCHLPNLSEPIAAMHASVHWDTAKPDAPVNKGGCTACHGASEKHMAGPTRVQPDVSYGPRWTSSIDAQNASCLNCHEAQTASGWAKGVHAKNDLTCSNCHNPHSAHPAARSASAQMQTCTVCHKVQKDGIHNLTKLVDENPPCTTCHDPHANPHPELMLLANRSEGCRACHDLQKMMADSSVSPRAQSYHKVMQSPDRTCIDCHRGVAHVDRNNFAAVLAGGFSSRPLTLFFPGQSDGGWLLSEHPGAQSLRQGRNCRQCHLGETQNMGERLAPAGVTPTVDIDLTFATDGDDMLVTVSWAGSPNDNDVAIMFSGDEVEDFAREGCWAACHSDMPGMTRARNGGVSKYLLVSRAQERSIGRPAVVKDKEALARMVSAGEYVELWVAKLDQGTLGSVDVYRILDSMQPLPDAPVSATGSYADGRWRVTFRRAMDDARKPIVADRDYTLGVAIHGDGKSGAQHWVSLPVTVSLDGFDTDFVAKP